MLLADASKPTNHHLEPIKENFDYLAANWFITIEYKLLWLHSVVQGTKKVYHNI